MARRKLRKVIVPGLITLVLLICYGLAATALWFQMPAGLKLAAPALFALLGLVLIAAFLRAEGSTRWVFMALTLLPLLLTLIWWLRIEPRNDRTWRPELARTMTAQVQGSVVDISGIRNFHWRSLEDFDVRWEDHSYDLDTLQTVDTALSYWGIDKIAHVMVSFGFEDGRHLVFSVEIRKELGEVFSQIGGFFKQFELSLIAATEEDIFYLRTNVRDPLEDVYLYPLDLRPETMRALFLSYLQLGNQLAEEPVWYNTLTANCSTVIYRLVRSFNPAQGFDLRFVLSGGLPEYLDEIDMLSWDKPRGDIRARAAISAKAQAMRPGQSYSRVIRAD